MSLFFQLFFFCLFLIFTSAHVQSNELQLINIEKQRKSSPFEISLENQRSKETIGYLMELLQTDELYGKWFRTDTQVKKSNSPKEGYSTILQLTRQESRSNNSGIKFCYYGTTNNDETVLCLKLLNFVSLMQESHFEEPEMMITKQNMIVSVDDTGDRGLPIECSINLTIRFRNKASTKLFIPNHNMDIDKDNLVVEFETESFEYPLNFKIRGIFPKYDLSLSDVLDYFIDIVLVGFTIQLLAAHWVSEALSSSFQQISLGKLIVIHTFDIYVAFQYWIGYIISIRPIKSIPAPSVMMILAFMTSVLHAVAQRQKKINQPGYSLVTSINYIFWLILSTGLILFSLIFKENKLILIFGCLHEVPQIIQNYIMQTKHTWNFIMFGFLSLPKLLYIAWVLEFSDVILGYNCSTELKIFIFLVALQFLVLLIQMKRPRIFVSPKNFYQIYHNLNSGTQEEICSICLDASQPTSNKKEHHCKKEEPDGSVKIITPCKHLFHTKCLKNWMKQNPICPYCRVHLPPII